jgi:hypothetical protein
MRKIMYLLVILFLFGTGFMNLDGNDWKPVELPSFLSGEIGERILPIEEWEEILIGEWSFKANLGDKIWKGTAIYAADKTFVKKLLITKQTGKDEYKSGGTFRGSWYMENGILYEVKEKCVFFPVYEICEELGDTLSYGKLDSDLWEYEISYFNKRKIEIRGKHLSETGSNIYRFSRMN